MIEREELLVWSKIATEEEIISLLRHPVFDSEDEGLLFLLVHLIPDCNAGDLVREWGIGKTLAGFLVARMAAAMVYLGADREEAPNAVGSNAGLAGLWPKRKDTDERQRNRTHDPADG